MVPDRSLTDRLHDRARLCQNAPRTHLVPMERRRLDGQVTGVRRSCFDLSGSRSASRAGMALEYRREPPECDPSQGLHWSPLASFCAQPIRWPSEIPFWGGQVSLTF
jgi:hypothetical protein